MKTIFHVYRKELAMSSSDIEKDVLLGEYDNETAAQDHVNALTKTEEDTINAAYYSYRCEPKILKSVYLYEHTNQRCG